jgi:hypothetical protein
MSRLEGSNPSLSAMSRSNQLNSWYFTRGSVGQNSRPLIRRSKQRDALRAGYSPILTSSMAKASCSQLSFRLCKRMPIGSRALSEPGRRLVCSGKEYDLASTLAFRQSLAAPRL